MPDTAGAGAVEPRLTRYAWLSIAAALATMAIKSIAYVLTDSVGLLSDALESTVNLVAAIGALTALRIAAKPADHSHSYGHYKAEYLSAVVEGLLILVAAGTITWAAIGRLFDPADIDDLGVGIAISAGASVINLVVGVVLERAGRRHRSITLVADGRHLLTDVWTSVGVIVGVGAVALTGWNVLDPIVALVVAANIVVTGLILIRRSVSGLMDASLDDADLARIQAVLDAHTGSDLQFHGLRTRVAGRRSFMSVHVLVPGAWTVQRSHDLVERLEAELRDAVPGLNVMCHVEPLEDPRSFADLDLDPTDVPPSARPGGP